MDNPIEILIYLFIIISILSSLFKKKEKPQSKSERQTPKPPLGKTQMKTSSGENYDILSEIENLFKTETTPPQREEAKTVEAENKFEPASEHFETAEWHEETATEHKQTVSEHSFESWEEKAKKAKENQRQAINEKIVKQAEMFEKNLQQKSFEQADIRKAIRQNLKQPTSLKEYILFSEILGKPKAIQE
jgi:hypothetical protein